tara:strand:- start:211 stop:447 length:237 start_codon:yes stop_codon:yes gene_type:complete
MGIFIGLFLLFICVVLLSKLDDRIEQRKKKLKEKNNKIYLDREEEKIRTGKEFECICRDLINENRYSLASERKKEIYN